MPSLSQLGGQFSSRSGIEEKKLNGIVNDIGSDHDTVMNLGFELDFTKVSIDKYDASNNKSGKVSTAGTREMMFHWKRNTSPEKQIAKLREALIKAKLTEIADTHLPVSDVSAPYINPWMAYADPMKRNLQTIATTLKTSEIQTVPPIALTSKAVSAPYFNPGTVYADPMKTSETPIVLPISLPSKAESPELLCLKCGRVTAQITDVINTKRSKVAVHSKVRNIKGKECLVQLMKGFDTKTNALNGRYDVITLTTADVKLCDNVFAHSSFDGYKEHIATWCKGCSQQVGWYYIPEDTKSAPLHALWLQSLIHDSYDSDNSLNAFYAKNRDEEHDDNHEIMEIDHASNLKEM